MRLTSFKRYVLQPLPPVLQDELEAELNALAEENITEQLDTITSIPTTLPSPVATEDKQARTAVAVQTSHSAYTTRGSNLNTLLNFFLSFSSHKLTSDEQYVHCLSFALSLSLYTLTQPHLFITTVNFQLFLDHISLFLSYFLFCNLNNLFHSHNVHRSKNSRR